MSCWYFLASPLFGCWYLTCFRKSTRYVSPQQNPDPVDWLSQFNTSSLQWFCATRSLDSITRVRALSMITLFRMDFKSQGLVASTTACTYQHSSFSSNMINFKGNTPWKKNRGTWICFTNQVVPFVARCQNVLMISCMSFSKRNPASRIEKSKLICSYSVMEIHMHYYTSF